LLQAAVAAQEELAIQMGSSVEEMVELVRDLVLEIYLVFLVVELEHHKDLTAVAVAAAVVDAQEELVEEKEQMTVLVGIHQ
jgi:hypothetical protein